MKIAINTIKGEFKISKKAYKYMNLDPKVGYYKPRDIWMRADCRLVHCIENKGSRFVSGRGSKIELVELNVQKPGARIEVDEFGIESVKYD